MQTFTRQFYVTKKRFREGVKFYSLTFLWGVTNTAPSENTEKVYFHSLILNEDENI